MKNTLQSSLALFAIVGVALAAACTTSTTETSNKGADAGGPNSPEASTVLPPSDSGAVACEPGLPEDVAAFLTSNCMPCHNTANRSGSVVLDTHAGLIAVPPPDRNGTPSTFASVGDLAVDELTSGGMPVKFNTTTGKLEPKKLDAAMYAGFKTWVNAGLKPTTCP